MNATRTLLKPLRVLALLLMTITFCLVIKDGEIRSINSTTSQRTGTAKVRPDRPPFGLTQVDWKAILAAHKEAMREFQPLADGWRSGNARFDRRGAVIESDAGWSWGLTLSGYGTTSSRQAISGEARRVTRDGQRISYNWNDRIEEWYQSDRRGLEHGFTLRKRPERSSADDRLALALDLRGNLTSNIQPGSHSATFHDHAGRENITYSGLKVWDATGKELAAWFEPEGTQRIRVVVDDRDASYPVTVDPWVEEAYLKASNPGNGDYLSSVSMDGERVIVGAPGESSNGSGPTDNSAAAAGAAYIFVRNGSTWTQEAYLKAGNAQAGDFFGGRVSIHGDTAVVAARGEDSDGSSPTNESASSAGAVYVFTRSGSTWTQQAYLKAGNAESNDYFGRSVDIWNDTIIVGAINEDGNGSGPTDNSTGNSGAAYIFTRSGSTWTQQAYLKAPAPDWNDNFGIEVGIHEDSVIISAVGDAPGTDGFANPLRDSGTAFVFNRSGSTWSLQGTLRASNAEALDAFGTDVDIHGDRAVVGADSEDGDGSGPTNNAETDSGAAYVFVRNGATWTQEAYLKADNAGSNDFYGRSVAIAGDFVAVGAPFEDGNGAVPANELAPASGAAYLYALSGTSWSQIKYLKASNLDVGDTYGTRVAISGYSAVVTAGTESSNGSSPSNNSAGTSGAAYVISTPNPITLSGVYSSASSSLGPGGLATVTMTLSNSSGSAVTTTIVTTLPAGVILVDGSCISGLGTCGTTAAAPGGDALHRPNGTSSRQAILAQTVNWNGTIPGNGSVTYTFQIRVGSQASSGTQYCLTSTIGGASGPSVCLTINAPQAGPGTLPLASGLPNQQRPGSILIYNLYTSGINPTVNDTRITLTNTNPVNSSNVHLFFVDGLSCSAADLFVRLTQNQTISLLASDIDPGVTGYLVAVATDDNGCPTIQNDLLGEAFVKFESGHVANLPAIGISGLGNVTISCNSNSPIATLAFDGVSYNELPRTLALDSIESRATGNSTMLVVNRIGGSLLSGASTLGSLVGILFDDTEVSQSFTLPGGTCQLRGILGNNFPRTAPRFDTVIPAGRTGWIKLWASDDVGLSGVMINEATVGFSHGHNLHSLTTTNSAVITIPVFPAR